jgi:hypothetical protein
MNKAMKILLAATLAIMASRAAMAGKGPSYICAYVNDNAYPPNAAEGYKVGPGSATAHLGPYSTNGFGGGVGFYAGGMGATRVRSGDLYVEDNLSSPENITHFTINKTDCTLTLDTTLYPSGDTGLSLYGDGLAITPDGRTMFVGSTGDFHIYSHTIAANGSLGASFTEASPSDYPVGIEVSPDGKSLVASYPNIQQVCAYPISAGHLGAPNCQSTVGEPAGVSIDPGSTCVYAAEAGSTSEIAAFTLAGGILGVPTDYNNFGSGMNSNSILANWNNKAIYIGDAFSAQLTIGSIASRCRLTYKSIVSDGNPGADSPGQIAQGKRAHGYVVTGDYNQLRGTPSMGIFRAQANGNLTPIGGGRFGLMSGSDAPLTVVVVGSK